MNLLELVILQNLISDNVAYIATDAPGNLVQEHWKNTNKLFSTEINEYLNSNDKNKSSYDLSESLLNDLEKRLKEVGYFSTEIESLGCKKISS